MTRLRPTRSPQAGFSMIEFLISTVIMSIVLGMVLQILANLQEDYLDQSQLFEIQTNAVTALDTMVRLVRMAGSNPDDITITALDADPDGNDVYDSIRIQADWNPADGALDDDYEDVAFTTSNDVLMISEQGATATPFLEGINAITFSYLDAAGVAIADPEANVGDIVTVRIALTAQTVGIETTTFNSSAAVRSSLD